MVSRSDVPSPVQPSQKRQHKRQQKTRHRGVLLLEPDGRHKSHRVRYREHGRVREVRLTPEDAATAKTREAFAMRLWHELQANRARLKGGQVGRLRAADTSLEAVLESYFTIHGRRIAKKTLHAYRLGTRSLLAYCARVKVRTVLQLTEGHLHQWSLMRPEEMRMRIKPGGKRGERVPDTRKVTMATASRDIRSVRTVMHALRRLGVITLTKDQISDALSHRRGDHEIGPFLDQLQIRQLLDAVEKHDQQLKKTARPIKPLVLLCLFGGLRVSEALAIKPEDWLLSELVVRKEVSKTKVRRVLDLRVSDTLDWMAVEQTTANQTYSSAESARKRLIGRDGAPPFSWHTLRRTCGSFLVCAEGIWKSASIYMTARQLGHSVAIAEKHYLGVVRVPKEANTLELAYGVKVKLV